MLTQFKNENNIKVCTEEDPLTLSFRPIPIPSNTHVTTVISFVSILQALLYAYSHSSNIYT